MPRGGKGLLWHYEAYDGPDQVFAPGLTETPTLTCFHCNVVVLMNPARTRDRGWCWNCNSYICDTCNAVKLQLGCHPIEQTLELAIRFPGRQVLLSRGPNGEVLGEEIALSEATKVYASGQIPKEK